MSRTVAGCECGVKPSSRDFGIEVQGVYDGILIWDCWSCRSLRPRFHDPADKWHRMALEIINRWSNP
jgi:hypothetical protein